jgi:hypothetical protein
MQQQRPLNLMRGIVLALSALAFSTAMAHGDMKPKHGGITRSASDLGFELVSQGDGVTLYVEDHGKPYATADMGGSKLTVLQGSEKIETDLKPAGDNKLEAKGIKLASGAKVVATIKGVDDQPILVRFSIK